MGRAREMFGNVRFSHGGIRAQTYATRQCEGVRNPLGSASKGSNPLAVVRDSIISGMAQACGSRECIARPDE